MTGRVCEVHGEWSATGVCRWCETLLDVAKRGRSVLPVVEAATWRNPRADEEPRVWRLHGFNEDGTIIHDWWEEIRLNDRWAALRWERVARRWAAKRPSPWMKLDDADMRAFAKRMVDTFLRWFYEAVEPAP